MIAEGTVSDLSGNPDSRIGPFLSAWSAGHAAKHADTENVAKEKAGTDLYHDGIIRLSTGPIHTVKPLEVRIPKGKLTVVTGVSGSGKTTLILESLVPGLDAQIQGKNFRSMYSPSRRTASNMSN